MFSSSRTSSSSSGRPAADYQPFHSPTTDPKDPKEQENDTTMDLTHDESLDLNHHVVEEQTKPAEAKEQKPTTTVEKLSSSKAAGGDLRATTTITTTTTTTTTTETETVSTLQLWTILDQELRQGIGKGTIQCDICQCTISNPYLTPCMHSFCKHCITEWITDHGNTYCPSCNQTVSSKRSLSEHAFLQEFASTYKLLLQDFSFVPTAYDPTFTSLTQVQVNSQTIEESTTDISTLVDRTLTAKCWQQALQQDPTKAAAFAEENAQVVRSNQTALLDAVAQEEYSQMNNETTQDCLHPSLLLGRTSVSTTQLQPQSTHDSDATTFLSAASTSNVNDVSTQTLHEEYQAQACADMHDMPSPTQTQDQSDSQEQDSSSSAVKKKQASTFSPKEDAASSQSQKSVSFVHAMESQSHQVEDPFAAAESPIAPEQSTTNAFDYGPNNDDEAKPAAASSPRNTAKPNQDDSLSFSPDHDTTSPSSSWVTARKIPKHKRYGKRKSSPSLDYSLTEDEGEDDTTFLDESLPPTQPSAETLLKRAAQAAKEAEQEEAAAAAASAKEQVEKEVESDKELKQPAATATLGLAATAATSAQNETLVVAEPPQPEPAPMNTSPTQKNLPVAAAKPSSASTPLMTSAATAGMMTKPTPPTAAISNRSRPVLPASLPGTSIRFDNHHHAGPQFQTPAVQNNKNSSSPPSAVSWKSTPEVSGVTFESSLNTTDAEAAIAEAAYKAEVEAQDEKEREQEEAGVALVAEEDETCKKPAAVSFANNTLKSPEPHPSDEDEDKYVQNKEFPSDEDDDDQTDDLEEEDDDNLVMGPETQYQAFALAHLPEESSPTNSSLLAVGTIVNVQSRTWPGVNKPGGVARITATHHSENTYDVAYILGGRESKVDAVFVTKQDEFEQEESLNASRDSSTASTHTSKRQRRVRQSTLKKPNEKVEVDPSVQAELPQALLAELAAQGFDVAGLVTAAAGKKKSKSAAATAGKKKSTKKRPFSNKNNGQDTEKDDGDQKQPAAKKRKASTKQKATTKKPTKPSASASAKSSSTKRKAASTSSSSISSVASRKSTDSSKSIDQQPLPKLSKSEVLPLAQAHYEARFQAAVQQKVVTVATSNLSELDSQLLSSLSRKSTKGQVQLKVTSGFNAKTTTLLLMSMDEQDSDKSVVEPRLRTLKAMRAALAGIPIVSASSWIKACISNPDQISKVPSPSIIATSLPTRTPGIRSSVDSLPYGVAALAADLERTTSKTKKQSSLLSNVAVFLCGNFPSGKRNDIQVLVKEAGGTFLTTVDQTISKLTQPQASTKVVLLCSEESSSSGSMFSAALERHVTSTLEASPSSVLVVDPNWLFDSIACGSMLNHVHGKLFAPSHPQAKALWSKCCVAP